jgi:hypothetical protein
MYEELWNRWSECHSDINQQKRMESAKKAACTPVFLDQTTGSAHFKGSSGNHTTSLEQCSCIDFNRRRLPCKHMYRLAMEFELIDADFASDKSQIVEPGALREDIAVTVSRVEKLTESQQRLLHEIASDLNSKKEREYPKNDDFCALVSSGLIAEGTVRYTFSGYRKADILQLADQLGITLPDGVKKKDDIIDYIIANAEEQLFSILPLRSTARPLEKIKYGKLNMYLHRKYDMTYCFVMKDEQFLDVPLLQTDLPNDDVTGLLREYGYY